jgi:hypothetical protein
MAFCMVIINWDIPVQTWGHNSVFMFNQRSQNYDKD